MLKESLLMANAAARAVQASSPIKQDLPRTLNASFVHLESGPLLLESPRTASAVARAAQASSLTKQDLPLMINARENARPENGQTRQDFLLTPNASFVHLESGPLLLESPLTASAVARAAQASFPTKQDLLVMSNASFVSVENGLTRQVFLLAANARNARSENGLKRSDSFRRHNASLVRKVITLTSQGSPLTISVKPYADC
jgi:hypothetical protein